MADAARKAGYSVTRIVRKAPPAPDVLERDLRFPLENVPVCDWVFHLAGGYAGGGRRAMKRADLRIARNLVRWGVKNGVKNWVFASAAEVYGSLDGLGTEDSPARPLIPYGEIKLAVEGLLARMAGDMPECRLAILRIGEVYGSESHLVRELAMRFERGLCPWPGSGRVPVSFVHAEDAAQAFLRAAERAPGGISIYNVADDVAFLRPRLRGNSGGAFPAVPASLAGLWLYARSPARQPYRRPGACPDRPCTPSVDDTQGFVESENRAGTWLRPPIQELSLRIGGNTSWPIAPRRRWRSGKKRIAPTCLRLPSGCSASGVITLRPFP